MLPPNPTPVLVSASCKPRSSAAAVVAACIRALSSSTTTTTTTTSALKSRSPHEEQALPRKPALSKARDMGGETATLLAQTVQATKSYQQQQQQQQQQQKSNMRSGGGVRNPPPFTNGQAKLLGSQLASRRRDSGAVYDADASAISGSSSSSSRSSRATTAAGPDGLDLDLGDGARRRPQPARSSQGQGHSSTARSPRAPRSPSSNNSSSSSGPGGAPKSRSPRGGPNRARPFPSSTTGTTGAVFTPPSPNAKTPTKVHYPHLDLASLVQADLAARRLATTTGGVDGDVLKTVDVEAEEHSDAEIRMRARAEKRGDYSRWISPGGVSKTNKKDEEEEQRAAVGGAKGQTKGKGKVKETGGGSAESATATANAGAGAGSGRGPEGVVQRAAQALSANGTVSLQGREFLLDKVEGMLLRK